MKGGVNVDATAILVGLAALSALAVGVYVWRRFDLGTKLNPLDSRNFASQGVETVITGALGREESAGTAAYELSRSAFFNPIGWLLRGTTTDDIDYSAPVTERERELVKRQSRNVNPRDLR